MTAIDMIKLAKAFMACGKYDKAEAVLQQCLVQDPELVVAIDLLISMRRRQGDLEQIAVLQRKLNCIVATFDEMLDTELANVPLALKGPGLVPAPFRIVRNLLPQSHVVRLLEMAQQSAGQFEKGEVAAGLEAMPGWRNSLRLAGKEVRETISSFLESHVRGEFEDCCADFGMPIFDIGKIEYKYCNYPDGSFFRVHRDDRVKYRNDNNEIECFNRKISFVYYFHRTPKKFSGGDLLLHDSDRENNAYSIESYLKIVPENNALIFFPSQFFHQVTDVAESSGDAMNGRFAINGHICLASDDFFDKSQSL